MWKCDKCGFELPIEVKPPIRCNCTFIEGSPRAAADIKISEKKEEQGRKVWLNLHTYKYTTEKEARHFYDFWKLTIPSFGCSCKNHWAELEAELPPDFSSACAFFKWGVDAHNKVNDRLGKPQFSYKDAVTLYGQDLCID